MKFKLSKLLWVGICGVILTWNNSLYALMGDYNSVTGNDMAVIGGYKSTKNTYKTKVDDDIGNIERQVLFVGVSRTMNPKLKLFGGYNYIMDSELEDADEGLETDNAYSLIGGADYTFFNKSNYSVSAFGQLDYLNNNWKWPNGKPNTIDGYELSAGLMGKYHFDPNVSVFATAKAIPWSDLTWKNSATEYESDVERDDTFGFQAGVMYDSGPWFVSGGIYTGMEEGFGLSGGKKF
jgi:predicted porin